MRLEGGDELREGLTQRRKGRIVVALGFALIGESLQGQDRCCIAGVRSCNVYYWAFSALIASCHLQLDL